LPNTLHIFNPANGLKESKEYAAESGSFGAARPLKGRELTDDIVSGYDWREMRRVFDQKWRLYRWEITCPTFC
jgi:hypothetical protein